MAVLFADYMPSLLVEIESVHQDAHSARTLIAEGLVGG